MHEADELALAMGAKRSGRAWVCRCPAHEDKSPSLSFWQGFKRVMFRCYAGCKAVDIVAVLQARGLLGQNRQTGIAGRQIGISGNYRQLPAAVADKKWQRAADERAARMRDCALGIWRESVPALGVTAVEWYLEVHRGLALDGLSEVERRRLLTETVRYHPACPRRAERSPALVVLMRGVADDRPTAIQRLYLDERFRKADALMLGSAMGTAMKLDAVRTGYLVVCEGFETALACKLMGDWPVWALGSAGGIERLPVLSGIQRLLIRADHDLSGTGQRAAYACAKRWRHEGREVTVRWPDTCGADYADVAKRRWQ